eukprot:Em0018g1172a
MGVSLSKITLCATRNTALRIVHNASTSERKPCQQWLFVASSRLLALLQRLDSSLCLSNQVRSQLQSTKSLALAPMSYKLPAFCGNINSWTEPDFYTVQVSPTTYFNWNGAVRSHSGDQQVGQRYCLPWSNHKLHCDCHQFNMSGNCHSDDHTLRCTDIVVSATDLDEGINAIHTYSLVQGDGTFIIDSVTGVITLAGQVSHANSPYTIDIQITDTGNPVLQSAGMVVTVHYVISYAPPKFTRNTYTVNINETLAMGPLWLVNVTATKSDPDPMAVIAYSIFSDPTGGLFSIDPVTGSVYIQGPLDVAISPQYVVIVQATLNIASPFNEYFCSGSVYRSYAAVRVFIRDTINQPPVCLHDVYLL